RPPGLPGRPDPAPAARHRVQPGQRTAVVNLVLLTDRRQARRPLDEVLARAVDAGARLVVLREKDLPDERRLELAERLRATLAEVGGILVVAGRLAGWDGDVHLSAVDAFPTPRPALVGRSCHDAAELAAAAD